MADNGYDGSIVINTELDNDGFEKGSDKLLSAVTDVAKQVNTLGAEMKNAFSGITSILQSMAAAANKAAANTGGSTEQATRAAEASQRSSQAQAQAAKQSAQTRTQAARQTVQAHNKTTESTKAATITGSTTASTPLTATISLTLWTNWRPTLTGSSFGPLVRLTRMKPVGIWWKNPPPPPCSP